MREQNKARQRVAKQRVGQKRQERDGAILIQAKQRQRQSRRRVGQMREEASVAGSASVAESQPDGDAQAAHDAATKIQGRHRCVCVYVCVRKVRVGAQVSIWVRGNERLN